MNDSFHLNTKLIGLFGHPIKHSFSPFIHNMAFKLLKLDYIYMPFDVPSLNLTSAVKGAVSLGLSGFNLTIPHKENILPLLDNLSEEASIIGSVNTVVNDLGKLFGYNTDVDGIIETLEPFKDELIGNEFTVVGAGGASRAVLYALIRNFKPSRINIINRTEQRAESLKNYFKEKMKFEKIKAYELIPPDLVSVFSSSKLIVNATSVGMYPETDDSITLLNNCFVKNQIVFDLVYNPVSTKLLKIASDEGAITLNGLKMLIHQAAKSFELWTNNKMPVDKVYASLEHLVND